MKVAIIGAGVAGGSVAFQLRKLNKDIEIKLFEKTSNTMHSKCSMPYVIEGAIDNIESVIRATVEEYKSLGIDICQECTVLSIDKDNKRLTYIENHDKDNEKIYDYDYLIIASGSNPFIPPIKGIEKDNKGKTWTSFNNIGDARNLISVIDNQDNFTIIGAGFIGVELAYALKKRGKKVRVIEAIDSILAGSMDEDMAEKVEKYLVDNEVDIEKGKKVSDISELDNPGFIIISAGVRPDTRLAEESGLEVNKGIVVDKNLMTSNSSIYANGDCCEIIDDEKRNNDEKNNNDKKDNNEKEKVRKQGIIPVLSTFAVRGADVIAHNILIEDEINNNNNNNNNNENNKKTYSTNVATVSTIGDMCFGRAGITQQAALKQDSFGASGSSLAYDKGDDFKDRKSASCKIICDKKGKTIGGQVVGFSGVPDKVDIISLAIFCNVSVDQIAEMDFCYNPACAPVYNAISKAASKCNRKLLFNSNSKKEQNIIKEI